MHEGGRGIVLVHGVVAQHEVVVVLVHPGHGEHEPHGGEALDGHGTIDEEEPPGAEDVEHVVGVLLEMRRRGRRIARAMATAPPSAIGLLDARWRAGAVVAPPVAALPVLAAVVVVVTPRRALLLRRHRAGGVRRMCVAGGVCARYEAEGAGCVACDCLRVTQHLHFTRRRLCV